MPGGLQIFRVFLYYIIMVNNFETIKNLLKFDKLGDCYYLQLLRRQSDDPMIGGMPDPNYHGNMHSRSIKDYFIPSLEYFEQKRMKSLLCAIPLMLGHISGLTKGIMPRLL